MRDKDLHVRHRHMGGWRRECVCVGGGGATKVGWEKGIKRDT